FYVAGQAVAPRASAARPQEQLQAARDELAKLLGQYSELHPRLQQRRAVILAMEKQLDANDQAPQPTSPKDRVTPTEEINAKAEQQPITLKVIGANLRDNQGATIGRVEDLVVDPASGRIEFLIVSAFYPTNSSKLMPIPWKA